MVKITFKQSDVLVDWDGQQEAILDAAEAAGLTLDYGCRQGNCTMCQQPILEGEVEYPEGHSGVPDEGHELLCCCVPKTDLVIDA
ncbi:MAG: 2Fe-2S iron-sulfur cluster-binding protein [Opitutales bacterium]